MYTDSETRSKVLEDWAYLAGCSDFLPYIQFYTNSGILSRPSDLYKLGLRHFYLNREIPDEVVYSTIEKLTGFKSISVAKTLLILLPDLEIDDVKAISESPCDFVELAERCKKSLYAGSFLEELERLSQLGVEFHFGPDDSTSDAVDTTPFTNKNIVVAGSLSAEHDVVKEALESLGASVQEKINKDTDYLILGEGAPDETDLAVKIGVRILTESDVAAMLGV